jgi:hypothetical protein
MCLKIDEPMSITKTRIMKYRYKILFLFAALAMTGIMMNCSDDSEGAPTVSYVRVTDPAASDSLLVAAGQGQMVAIVGQNLGSTIEVWFDDQKAVLNAAFITNTTIITRLPSEIPLVVDNKLKLVFANGQSLLHDFTIDINKPEIARMKSEYGEVGGEFTFYGNYFYEPLTVTFTGGVQAEIVSVEDDELVVEVPDGAQPGPVTIESNFGVTQTDGWFNDNRNIIANFEGPFVNGWWKGGDYVVTDDDDIENISGKFMRVNKGTMGAYPFLELYGGPVDGDVKTTTKFIPEEAFAKPQAYNLKFEMNTQASTTGINMRIYIGPASGSAAFDAARQSIYYTWLANVDTHGDWETVTIPWADVYNANQRFPYNPDGYGIFIYCHGPNSASYNFAMDNIRVVPIESE